MKMNFNANETDMIARISIILECIPSCYSWGSVFAPRKCAIWQDYDFDEYDISLDFTTNQFDIYFAPWTSEKSKTKIDLVYDLLTDFGYKTDENI